MKVYALRHKKTGEYSEGGRYAESTTKLPRKTWCTYNEFIKFLKYYVRTTKKSIEYHIERFGNEPNWKKQSKFWNKWKPTDVLKDFELVSFELEEIDEKNDSIAKIVKKEIS